MAHSTAMLFSLTVSVTTITLGTGAGDEIVVTSCNGANRSIKLAIGEDSNYAQMIEHTVFSISNNDATYSIYVYLADGSTLLCIIEPLSSDEFIYSRSAGRFYLG